MEILLDNKNGTPIYDQIYTQIKDRIIRGALKADEMLPSIRGLAKDLRISFITTKRAYDELEKRDSSTPCRARGALWHLRIRNCCKENLRKIEELLDQAIRLGASCGLSKAALLDMIQFSLEDYE